ncbi:MAG: ABC transporter permease [Pseudomonadota bacterium]
MPLGSALWALIGHWRRHPVQLAALIAGLAIATALWSGVQALNAEAKASYARAAETIGGGAPRLVHPEGRRIPSAVWEDLRRAGWDVSPLLEGSVEIGNLRYRLVGIDPLSQPAAETVAIAPPGGSDTETGGALAAFMLPPHLTLASPTAVAALGGRAAEPEVEGRKLPPLEPRPGLADTLLVVDIGVAQRVLDADDGLDALLIGARQGSRTPLEETSGAELERVAPEAPPDLDRLTDSFHMNLTAFGLLSFLVGLFIVHAAIGLAFEQRRGIVRTLRAMGVAARTLTAALAIEIAALAVVAGALGLAGGWLLAAMLLPDMALSLRGLYGAAVPGSLSLRPEWWLAGLAMALAGALAAAGQSIWRAYTMPVLEAAAPEAWAAGQARWLQRLALAGVGLALVALIAPVLADGLFVGFLCLGALVLAAALALPILAAGILRLAERATRPGLLRWFWADTRQQLGGLSLALMALLLALSVNIGVGTMVESFRTTFTGWIGNRLGADAYYRASSERQAEEIRAWLSGRPEVLAILPNWNGDTTVEGWPVEVYAFADDPSYRANWPLLDRAQAPWAQLLSGGGIFVSEQLSRRLEIGLGDRMVLAGEAGERTFDVAAIYADYGNPQGQVRISEDALIRLFPSAEKLRFGIRVGEGSTAALVAQMRERFGLSLDRLRDQQSLKDLSLAIFDRTFVVSGALNTLTLAVAGVALLTSLVTLSGLRLPGLAPVWAMGLTRRRLAAIELAKMLILAAVTAALAIPVGLAIAWMLVAVINVEAFGWRLPLFLFPMDWLRLVLLALGTAVLAAALPAWRLARTAPARLIAVFAVAR